MFFINDAKHNDVITVAIGRPARASVADENHVLNKERIVELKLVLNITQIINFICLFLFLKVSKIYITPVNAGATQLSKVESVSIDLKNFTAIAEWSRENEINLVVIGSEDPLANGIVDVLQSHGIPCFGPTQSAARIESDKNWSKKFMDKYLIPTARWRSFTEAKEATDFIEK